MFNFNEYACCDFKELFIIKVKKAKIRNRLNQVPHLIRDAIRESDTTPRIHHIQENQEVSPFQVGDHKAAMNRQDSMIKTIVKFLKVRDQI